MAREDEGKVPLTRPDQAGDMSVARHFAMGYLLDGGVDGVEEGFCFVCSWHLRFGRVDSHNVL